MIELMKEKEKGGGATEGGTEYGDSPKGLMAWIQVHMRRKLGNGKFLLLFCCFVQISLSRVLHFFSVETVVIMFFNSFS